MYIEDKELCYQLHYTQRKLKVSTAYEKKKY